MLAGAQLNFMIGEGEEVRSHFLSKWFGVSSDHFSDETPPQLISDLRDALEVQTPSHFSIELPSSVKQLNLTTAVRRIPNPSDQQHNLGAVHCEIFLRNGDSLKSLASTNLDLPRMSETPWTKLDCNFTVGGTDDSAALSLEFVSRWNGTGLAAQEGPAIAWETPRMTSVQKNKAADVLLISIDTFRSDALEHAPLLADTLSEFALWPQAVASSSWTLPAYASLFTGKPPQVHGAGRGAFIGEIGQASDRLFHGLDPQFETLAEKFAAAGYVTGLIHQNPFLEPWSGLDRGFSSYQRCSDDSATAITLADEWWSRHQHQPRFLVLHLIGPHLPYAEATSLDDLAWQDFFNIEHTPAQRREFFKLNAAQISGVREAYYNKVQALDQQLGPWLSDFVKKGRADVIAFHADHGEELWDDNSFEHGHSFDDSVVRVPVGIWTREIERSINNAPVSAHWLGASLLHAARIPQLGNWQISLQSPADESISVGSLYRTKIGGRAFDVVANTSRDLPLTEAVSGQGPAAAPGRDLEKALSELGYY